MRHVQEITFTHLNKARIYKENKHEIYAMDLIDE